MKIALALIATGMLAACSDMGATEGAGTDMAMQDPTPTQAMPFVAMAGASDLYEIESSRLALQKSQRDDVRGFAQMMIEHHTMTTQQVTAAARSAGLNPPPPQLMPMQADMIAQLQGASGAEFDRLYLTQQRRAHDMAHALHSNYSRSGDTPALRQVAGTAVPIIEQHRERLRTMR